MGVVVLVLLVVFLFGYFAAIFRRRGRGIVAKRGMSIGADKAALADAAQVRVTTVTADGPDRVRVVLTAAGAPPATLDVVVALSEDEFGWEQLRAWRRTEALLGMVTPPGSRIIRLRSVDDLQPLTLRRVDVG